MFHWIASLAMTGTVVTGSEAMWRSNKEQCSAGDDALMTNAKAFLKQYTRDGTNWIRVE